jgi:transcription termination factor NusB
MGSLFGGGSAKKAAKEQAAATREAARLAALSANYQAEANANQMTLAIEQRQQQAIADELLSTPMEAATVDLAVGDDLMGDDDMMTRRRTKRQSYQSQRTSGIVV